jgi:protein O-mannosyl-transferase
MPATWGVPKLAWKNWKRKPLLDREYEMSRTKPFSQPRARARKSPKSKAPSRTGLFLTGKKLYAALCVLLAMATIGLYSPAIGHSFVVLDDREYVTANPNIHGGLGWSTIHWAFTSTYAANWHPLTWLSHALDYQLFALNPAGHHLDSVLIHALNVVLLFLLLGWATKRVGPSLLVAALFAVHPINVESVAWVAERKNVLSTLFFFWAIGAYGWYARKPDWRRYLLVAALFAAGLMAKPMVITLPFVLLLLDHWPLNRTTLDETQSGLVPSNDVPRVAFSRLLLEKVPLLFLSAASAWLTLKAQRAALRSFGELPLAIRVENAIVAYGLYLWKMLWPARLAFYPHSVVALPAWQWILSALVLISVTAFVVTFRRKPYLPIGWFWFLGTLIPVIGLVQVGEYAMADRYAYVPLIGIFAMIAWSLADLADAKKVRAVWRVIPALCALAALGCVTYRQISYWDSDYDLWSHTLAVAENPLTHNALGLTLMHPESEMTQHDLENSGSEQMRMEEARWHFERALELRQPLTHQNEDVYLGDMARTLTNLGNLDRLQNRMEEARQHDDGALKIYRQLAEQNPDGYLPYVAATLNNLGSINRHQHRTEEARKQYEEALQIDRQLAAGNPAKYLPNMAMMLNELGFLDAMQNRIDEARKDYGEALKIDRQLAEQSPSVYLPELAMTLTNFGRLDAIQNRMDDARQHYEEALKIHRHLAEQNPAVYLSDLAMTLNNLGEVDQLQNRIGESRAHYQEALSLLRRLVQGDRKYAGGVARVEGSLKELDEKSPSK